MNKLIYIANSRIPTTKANGFQIIKMCEAFSIAGVDVKLWLPRRSNPIKEALFDYYKIRKTFNVEKIPVLDIFFLEKLIGGIANLLESFSFAVFAFLKLKKTLKRNSDVVIYSRDQYVLWLLSFTGTKFVYEEHVFPKNAWIYKRIWKKSFGIVVITEGIKNLIIRKKIDSNKILVAPDAVDLEDFNLVSQNKEELRIDLGLPKEDFLVGYVGKFKTLGMEKGIKTMIEALSLLDKDVKMIFVGAEEGEIKEYKNLIDRLHVFSQCLFFGYQPYIKAIKYMKAIDVLVIPFPNEPHYAVFASPLKLFEYMASGAPIVASDLPALREILNDKNAIFFKPGSGDDLAQGIKMLKSSQTLRYHLSQQALADVKRHTWSERANTILKFINIK